MKAVVNFFSTVGFVILTGLALVTGSASASTPDGETPANEGVCDMLKVDGVTKGLYGLCVAYCEAQDLDTIDKNPPSSRILSNYNKKKQPGDPDMPCVQYPCPCWTPAELYSVNDNGTASCNRLGTSIQVIDISPYQFADTNTDPAALRCRYVDTGLDPVTVRIMPATQTDANLCFNEVDQFCISIGQ